MLNPPPSWELVGPRAEGLLLGLALGEGASSPGSTTALRLTTQAVAVAEALLAGGPFQPADLLPRWLGDSLKIPERPGSITGEALRLFQRGLPAPELASAVATMVPGRAGDAPLSRCLPIAIAARENGVILRGWVRRCTGATHADPISQLAALAAAMLARDLLSRPLDDCLPRVAQALREDSPESFTAILHTPRPGAGLPAGDDAAGVLAAAVQALCEGRDWAETVAIAASRGMAGDSAPALAGALAGARWGVVALPEVNLRQLPSSFRVRLSQLARDLSGLEAEPMAPFAGRA